MDFSVSVYNVDAEDILLLFKVKDTGQGIPEDMLDNLTGEFVQLDSSLTRKYDGLGLGLALCQRILKN